MKINSGAYGAINLNNMIPVVRSAVRPLRFDMLPCSTVTERQYKDLSFESIPLVPEERRKYHEESGEAFYELMEKTAGVTAETLL